MPRSCRIFELTIESLLLTTTLLVERSVIIMLSVCLSVFFYPERNSKTNDPEVFKLGRWNDLGMS